MSMESRVLKMHIDAAQKVLKCDRATAEATAEAVLTATDGEKVRYVILAVDADVSNQYVVYGSYATAAAARGAIERGGIASPFRGRAKGFILPLTPAPKRERQPKKEK